MHAPAAQAHTSAPSRGINGIALSYRVEEKSERKGETHAESTGNLNPDVPRKPRIEIIIVWFSVFWFLIKVRVGGQTPGLVPP